MANDGTILIGKSGKPENLLLKLTTHGLVTGATGCVCVCVCVCAQTRQREGDGFLHRGRAFFARSL